MNTDYYGLLGVSRDADEGQIKKAYRRLAMQYHPDRVDGGSAEKHAAEEKFKEITEAYEVLRDPEKRAAYDRYGAAGLRRGAGGGTADFGFAHFDLSEALNIFMRDFGGLGGFDAFFGGGERARRERHRGEDLKVTLKLTLAEVRAERPRPSRFARSTAVRPAAGRVPHRAPSPRPAARAPARARCAAPRGRCSGSSFPCRRARRAPGKAPSSGSRAPSARVTAACAPRRRSRSTSPQGSRTTTT